ncbi:hypothetical protein [Streptomyces sp. NPDC014006]|uniref:hypothetical protein n=1 Tax=Streptomyces sp. NPDC014006 TaxID=3364870 RepID=UPI0036FE7133
MGLNLMLFMADWKYLSAIPIEKRAQALEDAALWPPELDGEYCSGGRNGGWVWLPHQESAWCAEYDYANDLGDERALIAVSAASNRSKADQDPTTWLPPAAGYRCQYVADWIADKMRWRLSIDENEEAALSENLNGCPNTPVTVVLAR